MSHVVRNQKLLVCSFLKDEAEKKDTQPYYTYSYQVVSLEELRIRGITVSLGIVSLLETSARSN